MIGHVDHAREGFAPEQAGAAAEPVQGVVGQQDGGGGVGAALAARDSARTRGARSRSSSCRRGRAGAGSSRAARTAWSRRPTASRAMTHSAVSAAVTQDWSDTQRTPTPSSTNSDQRPSRRSQRRLAGERPRQDRVVPVHGPALLGREAAGPVDDRLDHPVGGQLPFGPLEAEALGDGDRAAQAVVDRRGAGQQGVAAQVAVGVHRPQHLAPGLLQAQHETDGGLDDRPHALEQPEVAGAEVVPPGSRWRRRRRRWDPGAGPRCLRPGGSGTRCRRAAGSTPASRRPARPRGAGRPAPGPWPPRCGSTGRRGRPGTTGSCRWAAAPPRSTAAVSATSAGRERPRHAGFLR